MLSTVCSTLAFAVGFQGPQFAEPVQLEGGGEPIRIEHPGYAAPCLHDIDGDGDKDLIVGQFARGALQVFENTGDGKYAAGEWLQAGGKSAIVPGVW